MHALPNWLRQHWLALAAVLRYLLRWAQYRAEAALGWLVLGQLVAAGAWWWRAQWRVYLGLPRAVALPFLVLFLINK